MTRNIVRGLIVLVMLAGCSSPQPQPQTQTSPSAQAKESEAMAQEIYERGMRNVARRRKVTEAGVETGELFCWYTRGTGHTLLNGYQAFGDRVWLDYAAKYLDELVASMATGPDGYRGFIGTYGYDETLWCDVHIGDSILINLMLEFAEIVLADDDLAATYDEKARGYVALAKRDLIEKWDARGTWREDGPYGGYVGWDHYGQPGDFTHWKRMPDVNRTTLAIPFNKSMDMAVACLRIYRITGETAYRDKATKVFAWMKSRMQFLDEHYVWNYWEPLVATDVDLDAGNTRHWMNVHPYRNYQAGEVGDIVEAYHTGVVFTELDIRRILNTNLKVMWNGDMENPAWQNSNQNLPGWRAAKPSSEYPGRAGTLWTALADFDQTIRDLWAKRIKAEGRTNDRVAAAYFRNVICAEPPSFQRRQAAGGVRTMDVPFSECDAITVAAALPATMGKGESTILLAKVPVDGRMEIALYSADGQTRLADLFAEDVEGDYDGHGGVIVRQWKAAVEPGDYRIRWTFGHGYREFPITVGK